MEMRCPPTLLSAEWHPCFISTRGMRSLAGPASEAVIAWSMSVVLWTFSRRRRRVVCILAAVGAAIYDSIQACMESKITTLSVIRSLCTVSPDTHNGFSEKTTSLTFAVMHSEFSLSLSRRGRANNPHIGQFKETKENESVAN